jgi:phosphonate transport system substrate-binding protein
VQIERLGTHTYFGIIFAKRDKKIEGLADLKGKTIALVSETSTSGGLYPQLALIKAGLIPGKDITILWTGSHTEVAKAVDAGKADAGGCYEDCREAVWKDNSTRSEVTKIIAYTEDIPAEAVLVKRSLAKKLKRNLRKTFIRMNKEGGILNQISENEKQISAFVAAADKNIAGLSKVIREVENALKPAKPESKDAAEAASNSDKADKAEKKDASTNDG